MRPVVRGNGSSDEMGRATALRQRHAADEMSSLRVKDVDFGRGLITVRSGKGDKDRVTCFQRACIQRCGAVEGVSPALGKRPGGEVARGFDCGCVGSEISGGGPAVGLVLAVAQPGDEALIRVPGCGTA